jgi:hypothetical protein
VFGALRGGSLWPLETRGVGVIDVGCWFAGGGYLVTGLIAS